MAVQRYYIEDLKEYIGENVEIKGWVYNKRSSGKIKFLILRDGTGFLQCIMVKGEVSEQDFDAYKDAQLEASVKVVGNVRVDTRAPGGIELNVKSFKIIGKSENYPIPKVREDNIPDVGVLLPIRHLWLRSKRQWAIMRIRDTVERAIVKFFEQGKFIRIDAPILTPSACEGTTTLFKTDYFGDMAYLTQSGQLYVEAAAMALGKVYCFGPAFRAEKSKTRRHLTEFWQVEPEVAFAELPDIMKLAESLVSFVVQSVLKERKDELLILGRDITKLENITPPFPRISYDKAVDILHKNGNDTPWGEDFGGDEETIISNAFEKPVIVYNYPAKIKPFYMKKDADSPDKVLCMDILAPEGYGEIIGGSQREDDYDELLRSYNEFNLPLEDYRWYLELRKYGTVPHSGFGMGIERTLAWITGIKHVREAIPFPRLLDRIYP